METELKCNRLTCRNPLTDKAVVTTCSHIFCIDCANQLFSDARLCPACETLLTEPDDVVVCSLHPTNDYKTSVLSGLTPLLILEICSRAISFWQYQIHQENSFQQAVLRSVNDKNAQLQKQLDNVIREANGEINLLSNKLTELERDLELERRKVRDLQESSRERDKEYQKLKLQYDKIKRRALLGSNENSNNLDVAFNQQTIRPAGGIEEQSIQRRSLESAGGGANIGAVIGGMEANKIQRTPLVTRTGPSFDFRQRSSWQHPQQMQPRTNTNRQPFPAESHRPLQTHSISDLSENEVENLVGDGRSSRRTNIATHGSWPTNQLSKTQQHQRGVQPQQKRSGVFRPPRL